MEYFGITIFLSVVSLPIVVAGIFAVVAIAYILYILWLVLTIKFDDWRTDFSDYMKKRKEKKS